MTRFYRKRRFTALGDNLWYSAVANTKNPIVRGYLAEQILLEHIAQTGLSYVNKSLRKMDYAWFVTQPSWKMDQPCCLYIPSAYNYQSIDGIILSLDSRKKHAHLFPVQITLSRKHKNVEDPFYRQLYPEWIKSFQSDGFTVDSTFVWIDEKGPNEEQKAEQSRKLRGRTIVLAPGHTSVHIGVRHVDKRLADQLAIND
jgi:hypothetical protein